MNDANSGVNVQRKYKDTIFRMLFSEKENLLSLYNALNGTSYKDVNELKITTLENAVYMNFKNDISFVLSSELMLYEHQSTVNPNMPLRDLFYVARVAQGLTKAEDFYGRGLVKIPAPRFIVFYNGTNLQPERQVLRLSDAFEGNPADTGSQPDLELTVTVYNINLGYNPELLDACRTLKEYAQYVQQVREYAKKMPFEEAVEAAVDYCIVNGILEDFLSRNRAEAIAMSIFEYNEELHIKSEKELSFQEGYRSGKELGIQEGMEKGMQEGMDKGMQEGMEKGMQEGMEKGVERLSLLNKKLLEDNRIGDLRRSLEDKEYQKQLYTEYGL